MSCFKCGTPKPPDMDYGGGGGGYGGGAPMGGGGGSGDVRPGDWTCPGCGANVFASKSSCFKCATPRP
jgi:hypothetical protein